MTGQNQPYANDNRRIIVLFSLCCFVALAVPILIYLAVFGGVPSTSPADARKTLVDGQIPSALIDVRQPQEFREGHIYGAVNLPLDEILSLSPDSRFFREYKDHTLFFVCSAGFSSGAAVKAVKRHSAQPVFNITGGMQKWPEGTAGQSGPYFSLVSGNGPPRPFPEKPVPLSVQLIACVAAFAIKPLYMILSLIIIVFLRGATSFSGKALRLSMILFLFGESFCALNYLFFGENSFLIEYLHMAGMVAAFGFAALAAFQFIDLRLMNISEMKTKCSANNLCGSCYKYADVSCRFTQMFSFVCLSLMICSIMPLLAETCPDSYNTDIFGTMYNYAHPFVFQFFEIRYAPLTAILFFGLSFLCYRYNRFRPSPTAMLFFSVGAGFLTFSFFRLFLFSVYAGNLWWYIIWEEITELLFIAGICLMIWIFRPQKACPGGRSPDPPENNSTFRAG